MAVQWRPRPRTPACMHGMQAASMQAHHTAAPAGVLHIVQGLHPVHGHSDHQTKEQVEMLPNDVSLSRFRNFNLLLGPNYSGKSTLLAQVGLLCIMAQAGLFVPAQSMVFHPFGNILTHLTGHKDLYSTSSSLMLEAQVMQPHIA